MRKAALSPQTTLNYLRARAAQGVHVPAQLLESAATAARAGGAVTPAPMRQLALHTAESAQGLRRAEQFAAHPIPAARRSAAETVTGLEHTAPERMFASPEALRKAEVPMPSAEKTQMLFGGGGQLHDPDRLTSPIVSPTLPTSEMLQQLQNTPPPTSGVRARMSEPGTAVGRAPQPPAPAAASDATGVHNPFLRRTAAQLEAHPYALSTNTPGRLKGQIPQDPADTARTAFSENQRQVDIGLANTSKLGSASRRLAAWAEKNSAAHKLDGRTTFRGLEISIETGKGKFRFWYDPHEKREGKTKMLYPYGYIRRTKGLDGDHVDVFIGPNEQAENVYVILTKKAPNFEKDDEEKCMLGFDSLEAAKKAFLAHYDDPRFISDVTAMPFSVFAARVKDTFDGKRKKVAGDTGAPRRNLDTVYWGGHAGGSSRPSFQSPTGISEKPRGLAPAGESKLIIGEPALRQDRIDRSFGYMDNDQNTTAIEGAWGSPGTASTSIP